MCWIYLYRCQFSYLVKAVENFHIQERFVGQSYDWASVLGVYVNGFERKVLDAYPFTTFTHCYTIYCLQVL